ncbi:MAG TPA: phosphoenolpyruvate--protein phosphotransferase [Acetobacteraceae bacterium]|nr:phosphoenolpyruvate--protein phosphotransferase [Acetobacteraceae bacterium]
MSRTETPRRRPSPARRALPEQQFLGIAIASGVGIGPAFGTREPPVEIAHQKIAAADIEAEGARLEAAIVQSRKQLAKLRARLSLLPEDSQAEIGPLIDAYLRMLGPSRLIRGARRRIAEGLVTAETAITEEADAIATAILATPGDEGTGRRRRAEEVHEIARRLVRNLTRQPYQSFSSLPDGAVLIAEQLRPADVALIDPSRIAGVAAAIGGREGHTAVLLRALGIPSVLGAAGVAEAVRPGALAIVDGASGTVILDPSEESLAAARRSLAAFARERARLSRLRRLSAETLDGQKIELQANLELPRELPLVAQSGAAGIGLLRSEFLFMNREDLPDEDVQTDHYRSIVEAMAGDPVTIRVLDWGGEKDVEAFGGSVMLPSPGEANPALGMRGIRLLLRRPELFEEQLAAILRAAVAGPVRILLPMVTSLAEVRAARETYERVVRRLRRRGERLPEPLPPLGIMIETPGAALAADALAFEVDFFAIGTNDLAMYALAVDRSAADVAALYDPLHPAVLRLVQFATEAALRTRRSVSVCGEMAADPRFIPLLVGLGLRSFSMNASAVPRVKQAVRGLRADDCARLAHRVMERGDPNEIRAMIEAFSRAES